MAFIVADIKIPQTATALAVQLYFPTDLPETVGNQVKGVITLLHGMGNSPGEWMHMSAACRYAADNGYILVAPAADNSFYNNMAFGPPWHTILSELLPAQLQRIFKIPTEREMNYVAGLSMGGYGALCVGLTHPDRYAAIGSFSGSVHATAMMDAVRADPSPAFRPLFEPVWGEALQVPETADVFALLQKTAGLPGQQQPRVYCTCGLQDQGASNSIVPQNRALRNFAATLPVDFTYEEWDGVHEWNFWDRSLARFIGFIQNSDYGTRKQEDWSSPIGH